MRSSVIFTAAFAATAFSTPLKRDLIIETDTATDLAYVTDVVTVTAGAEAAAATTSTVAVVTTTAAAAAANSFHWGHHSWQHSSSAAAVTTSEAAAASSSSSEAAPAPASTSSSVAAPAPVSSSSSVPAPAYSSSTEAAAAPSSYSSTPASTSSSVASTTSAASAATASTYQEAVINHHNYHRANHSAPAVTWSDEMASLAATIAQNCSYTHIMDLGTYGQNIAAGVQASDISTVISDLFYNGEVNAFSGLYGQANPDMSNFENWGHFSQIVWKGTTQVGCATAVCNNYGGLRGSEGSNIPPYFTVCNYSPPGNYGGEYGSNIGNSLGDATITGTYDVASTVTGDGM